ncbi:signal transduction histidine kinase [Aneurinibacillus soli]|uniref:histidine kinase n=2 Tax=Aneurinibacillus soli TaxID=1500254 RepID=A0A0U5B551_9BACL|nr:ATP-binding protein [Aneurinibacillus soli]PYE62252.1 signal transduction histidine kinase [Aneurinibacillus soli]BAU28559.1 Signal transduction histidine-protein kinase ArlS [Aneurinibacillus soli]
MCFVRYKNTLMFRFTVWYIVSLLAVVLLIGIMMTGTVSYFLFKNTKQEMEAIQYKLQIASQEDKVNWQETLDELLYPDHANYFIEINDSTGKTVARSRGWEKDFNNEIQKTQRKWFKGLLWDDQDGLFFVDKKSWSQKNGQKGQMHIAVQLSNIENLLILIVKVLGLTTVVGALIGSFLIYHLTRRNMRPLLAITDAVDNMKHFPNLSKRIPVPEGPQELTNLSSTFNTMLQELERQFEREKGFIADASHELRTPLTALRGNLKLLKRRGKDNPEIFEKSIASMDEEGLRMQRLISQLLELARSDHVQTKKIKVNVATVIQDAVEETWQDSNGISLTCEVDERIFVLGDIDQLRQVTVILLENAKKYTNTGGSVKIFAQQKGDHVEVSVQDSGIGIPEEDIPKIFNRFYRVDKARSRKTGGTGLGLSIAKQLVELHNGAIDVQSVEGKGSIFTVYLTSASTSQ